MMPHNPRYYVTLLERAGFRVERSTGPVGAADPGAFTARRD